MQKLLIYNRKNYMIIAKGAQYDFNSKYDDG